MLARKGLVSMGAVSVALASCLVTSTWAAVVYDSDGTKTLTQDGWTLAGTVGDQFVKSKDFSSGQADVGTNGVWNINDDNVPSNAYMKMYKDPSADSIPPPAGGIDQSQGMILARVKAINGSGGTSAGTFGYSSASGNHSVVMSIRPYQSEATPAQINWKTAEGGNASISPVNLDTSGYRVYAIAYTLGGTFNSWYSTTNAWSSNQADWVQAATNATCSPQSAPIDQTNTKRDGLLMGSFGGSAVKWQGNVDYIGWSKNSDDQLPWSFLVSSLSGTRKTTNAGPGDGGTGVSLDDNLGWTAGAYNVLYDVYFGTDPNALPLVSDNQPGTGYEPGTLLPSQTYHWRINPVNALGYAQTGDVWSFTTLPEPITAVLLALGSLGLLRSRRR